MDNVKIAVDAMGGDNAPFEIVKGAVDAVNEFGSNIILVGPEKTINDELEKYTFDKNKISVVNATEVMLSVSRLVSSTLVSSASDSFFS